MYMCDYAGTGYICSILCSILRVPESPLGGGRIELPACLSRELLRAAAAGLRIFEGFLEGFWDGLGQALLKERTGVPGLGSLGAGQGHAPSRLEGPLREGWAFLALSQGFSNIVS